MTRDQSEAQQIEATMRQQIGQVDRWGRITDTLVGVETETRDFRGRPLYMIKPVVENHDPLFDA